MFGSNSKYVYLPRKTLYNFIETIIIYSTIFPYARFYMQQLFCCSLFYFLSIDILRLIFKHIFF